MKWHPRESVNGGCQQVCYMSPKQGNKMSPNQGNMVYLWSNPKIVALPTYPQPQLLLIFFQNLREIKI